MSLTPIIRIHEPGVGDFTWIGELSVWNFANDDGVARTSGEFRWYPYLISSMRYDVWTESLSGTWSLGYFGMLRLYIHGTIMTQWSTTMELSDFAKDFGNRLGGLKWPEKGHSNGQIYDGDFEGMTAVTQAFTGYGSNTWRSVKWKFNRYSA